MITTFSPVIRVFAPIVNEPDDGPAVTVYVLYELVVPNAVVKPVVLISLSHI